VIKDEANALILALEEAKRIISQLDLGGRDGDDFLINLETNTFSSVHSRL